MTATEALNLHRREIIELAERHGATDVRVFGSAARGDADDLSDSYKLAHETEWSGDEGQPMRGIGQKTYLVGEEAIPIMELEKITFNK